MRFTFPIILFVFFYTCAYAEGNIESLSRYEYWDSGSLKKREVYDLKGALRIKTSYRTDGTIWKMECYDKFGNRTEEAFYSQKGDLKSGIDGWAVMRWNYDDSHLVSQISYDESGAPIQRLLFSASGKLIARQYANDAHIDPYEVNNTIAIILKNRESVARE